MRIDELLDGRYRLMDRIGAGGMSVVWKAHDEVLDRAVAVKVLAGPEASAPEQRHRIRAEARSAARLWHPNVTSVYDYGEATGDAGDRQPYVVMELLPGPTLSKRLAAGPLPALTALRICSEVASALAAAHAQGVVHRDVKPSNVILTPSGAKVVDFGIAARTGQPDLEVDGTVLGSPAYLAPERLLADEVLPASDVYALGVLIYRALTNAVPWPADTTTEILAAHVHVPAATLPPIEDVPDEVSDICARCLAKEPDDRPSAAEVADVLGRAAWINAEDRGMAPDGSGPGRPVEPRQPVPTVPADDPVTAPDERRRGRALALLAAAVIVALATMSLTILSPFGDGGDGSAGAAGIPSPTGGAAGSTLAPSSSIGAVPVGGPGTPAVDPSGGASTSPQIGTTRTRVPDRQPPVPVGTTPAPPPPGTAVTALGGVVRVLCTGSKAEVLRVDPNPGYIIKDNDPGPDKEVQVVLLSAINESEIKVKCDNGVPVPEIKESPQ